MHPMPISSHATKNIHTVAETVDFCPDFYHWQANVAGAHKVSGKIPEDICVGLLEKYQAEKLKLQNERSEIEKRQADTTKERANVDEFISRLKTYLTVPVLTREMCMELIEFVTVDKCPGKYSKEPREIHIYYKLIDKTPPPEKKYLDGPMCEDC